MREVAKAFKALADETKQRILSILLERECCVCEVMQALEISQSKASRGLSALYDAGFLKLKRDGLWSVYSIDSENILDYQVQIVEAVRKALASSKIAIADRERLKKAARVGPGCSRSSVRGGTMKTVLFICNRNVGRSQMGEAWFNHLAGGKARAISAGITPAERINPTVAQVMGEVGIDMSGQKPKALTLDMMENVDRAITMCGAEAVCPVTVVPTEHWEIDDPSGKTVEQIRKIRDEIKTRVTRLVKGMTAEPQ